MTKDGARGPRGNSRTNPHECRLYASLVIEVDARSSLHDFSITGPLVESSSLPVLNLLFLRRGSVYSTLLKVRTRWTKKSSGVVLTPGQQCLHRTSKYVGPNGKGQSEGVRTYPRRTLVEGLFDEQGFGDEVRDKDPFGYIPSTT